MKEEEIKELERGYKLDILNENGLRLYIKYLRGEIRDYSERIKEVIKEKGLHKE